MTSNLFPVRAASLFDGIDLEPGDAARRRIESLAGEFLTRYRNPRTREAFSLDLRTYLSWLASQEEAIDPLLIRAGHVNLFMIELERNGRSAATINRRVGSVCLFYRWLHEEDFIPKNPTLSVKRPKVPRVSKTAWMTRYQMRLFLAAAKKEGGYPYALAALLIGNGLRISEALNADVEDLGVVDEYHYTLDIVGKGDQPATVALGRQTIHAINKALDGRDAGPLLLNKYRNRMTRQNASVICKRLGAIAAPGKRMHPHVARHSAITGVGKASNGNVMVARAFARHADVRTTQLYLHDGDNLSSSGSYLLEHWLAGGD